MAQGGRGPGGEDQERHQGQQGGAAGRAPRQGPPADGGPGRDTAKLDDKDDRIRVER